ncbi:MAG TPA: class I SAM-dependent methyltransferase [Dermatophilaceae bacterium]|nr:class I SAM-dependent methyltransferase [Dermatophilaceae bacterium]
MSAGRSDEGPLARVAATFDRVAEVYDTVGVPWFRPIAERLVERVAPARGEHVVDVGSGRGAVTWPLVAAVGPQGRVTAVDISSRMTALLREEGARRGVEHLDVLTGDVADLGLAGLDADALTASLVLFFSPDPARTLRGWLGCLRPGGRVGLSTFGEEDEAFRRLDALFEPHLPPAMLDARTTGKRGPFASPAATDALVAQCGGVDVHTVEETVEVAFAGVEQWHAWSRSHGMVALWAAVPEAEHPAVLGSSAEILGAVRGPDGLSRLRQVVRYTTARVPAEG